MVIFWKKVDHVFQYIILIIDSNSWKMETEINRVGPSFFGAVLGVLSDIQLGLIFKLAKWSLL